jgi:CHAT domain-containing protein
MSDTSLAPLVSEYVISYLSSYEAIVDRGDSRVAIDEGAVIFSNPSRGDGDRVSHGDGARQLQDIEAPGSWLRRVDALPRSEEEARAVAGLLGADRVAMYTGAQATRDQLRASVQLQKPIYHFATHGYFSSDYSDIGGLVLADTGHSGQLVNRLFTIQDARSTRIAADLIVLNGCETGLGDSLRGEGVTGITRAFIDSGARHAVSTLWKVPDRPSMEIMKSFYSVLVANDGQDVAAALAAAQRRFLRDNPRLRWRPGHWGAYIHYQR